MMDKKGQVLSGSLTLGWRLFLLAAITLFVALTVGSTFVANQDVRPVEATILGHRVLECITQNGVIESNFNLENCFIDSTDYYVSANLTSMDSNFSRIIESGSTDLRVFCKVQEDKVSCVNQRAYVLIKNQNLERGIIELTVGVKKYDKNS